MEAGNKAQVNLILRSYKNDAGGVNFPAVFSIPTTERIPELAKQDFSRISMLIIGALTMAFENMNIKRGMNEMQILDLAEMIIDSAGDDNLSFEDLMLFLQKMVRGEYDMSYESMDLPKFMKMFQAYRDSRKLAIEDYRMNQHLQHKGMGQAERVSQPDPLAEHFSRLGETMSNLRESLKETKRENRNLKDIDKF